MVHTAPASLIAIWHQSYVGENYQWGLDVSLGEGRVLAFPTKKAISSVEALEINPQHPSPQNLDFPSFQPVTC